MASDFRTAERHTEDVVDEAPAVPNFDFVQVFSLYRNGLGIAIAESLIASVRITCAHEL